MALAGRPLARFLEFPPRPPHVEHAPFDWLAFGLLSLPALAAAATFVYALRRPRAASGASAGFPRWGALGVLIVASGWVLAWNEGLLPPPWRRHMFTVLWLGYIVTMNALAFWRSGRSPMTDRPGGFLALFPASIVFWWLFEYLNQFSANWHYAGVTARGQWDYLLQASLPFSTVLPALTSTRAWLATFARLDSLALPPLRAGAWLAWLALLAGSGALVALPLAPEALFAMLWLAPLLVLAALQYLVLRESLFAPLAHGDWRPVLQPALAGLVCGFFWELWNYGSLAQWHYSIPYVNRFHVFEMPLLGYAGYLPFGIECALVAQLCARLCGDAR